MYEKLYRTRVGRGIAAFLARPGFSRAAGWFMDTRASKVLIRPFIQANRIDLSDVADARFDSFNAFFTRRLKPGARPVCEEADALASPCDAYLTVMPVSPESVCVVKGTPYTVETLTRSAALSRTFDGGWLLIFRLTPAHYHRYAFPDDGKILETKRIPGVFHTVRPEALAALPVFKTNTREYALLETAHFGRMLYMEVGATMVGRIVNDKTEGAFRRGEEKGRFEFGGSTVILITEKGAFEPDARFSAETEVSVQLGEAIGKRRLEKRA